MITTEQLTSLGATVLQSDVSFCGLHHLPVSIWFRLCGIKRYNRFFGEQNLSIRILNVAFITTTKI